MKKLITVTFLSLCLLAGCSNTNEPAADEGNSTTYVDTYTSASSTKQMLDGNDLKAAKEELSSIDSDLATLAQTKEDGYVAPEGETMVEIMSVNPDGTPGLSTIHAWRVDGDTVTVVLTDGQNAQNLAKVGARGSILAHGDTYYLIHLEVSDIVELEYTDENYENGLFNSSYSGASNQLSEYTITMNILSVEQVNLYIPN